MMSKKIVIDHKPDEDSLQYIPYTTKRENK